MARLKVARRVTYRKRVKDVIKRTKELSVLCDVDACTVICGPNDEAPVVWLSSKGAVERILENFNSKPEMDARQDKLSQREIVQQSVTKAIEILTSLERRNREEEMRLTTRDLLIGKPIEQVAFADVPDLIRVIDDKMRALCHRRIVMESANNRDDPSSSGTGAMGSWEDFKL